MAAALLTNVVGTIRESSSLGATAAASTHVTGAVAQSAALSGTFTYPNNRLLTQSGFGLLTEAGVNLRTE